jgi:lipid-binding SYLF domain-containing protein
MVFKNEKGFNSLLDSKLKLGADASVAAGPVGRSGEASTDAKLNAEIYSYSRSKGLFAGISLDGAVLTIDDSANRKVYGRELTGRDILLKGVVAPNGVTRPFVDALKHWAPKVSQNR